jgi:CubicO group peptidase (beta-lactamase class C family)
VEPVLRSLEAQQPQWAPGTQVGYHGMTYGYLVGELVRRVSGRSLGTFFRDEVATPLGLRAWIGLPEDLPVDVATIERSHAGPGMLEAMLAADPDGSMATFVKGVTLGGALPASLITDGKKGDFNDRRVLAAEIAGVNMVADARALARGYAATVSEVDGFRLLSEASAAACVPLQTTTTPIFGAPPGAPRTLDFGLGFLARPYLSPSSFGHPGASGAVGFADVDARVGFGYIPRLMRPDEEDQRSSALIAAVRSVLG